MASVCSGCVASVSVTLLNVCYGSVNVAWLWHGLWVWHKLGWCGLASVGVAYTQ